LHLLLYHGLHDFVKKGADIIKENGKKITPQEKYDKANTQFIGLKLNKNTDKDILEAIDGKSKQTEIKRLIRLGLKNQ